MELYGITRLAREDVPQLTYLYTYREYEKIIQSFQESGLIEDIHYTTFTVNQ